MNAHTKFGSLDAYDKGGIEITGKETRGRYLFSNMFEVAANAEPWARTVVARNLEFTIEVSRTQGSSPWYICAHDETVLVMEGALEVHFIKPGSDEAVPPEDKEGAVRLAGTPDGAVMGHVAATRGHLVLLPAGAAYQIRSRGRGVALYQSALGEESIEKWAEICLR